jgi:hypothetical protein
MPLKLSVFISSTSYFNQNKSWLVRAVNYKIICYTLKLPERCMHMWSPIHIKHISESRYNELRATKPIFTSVNIFRKLNVCFNVIQGILIT